MAMAAAIGRRVLTVRLTSLAPSYTQSTTAINSQRQLIKHTQPKTINHCSQKRSP